MDDTSFNRTFLVLKYQVEDSIEGWCSGFNRTFLVLKLIDATRKGHPLHSFNRTF